MNNSCYLTGNCVTRIWNLYFAILPWISLKNIVILDGVSQWFSSVCFVEVRQWDFKKWKSSLWVINITPYLGWLQLVNMFALWREPVSVYRLSLFCLDLFIFYWFFFSFCAYNSYYQNKALFSPLGSIIYILTELRVSNLYLFPLLRKT